jgi:opacity protein-like surface antigen
VEEAMKKYAVLVLACVLLLGLGGDAYGSKIFFIGLQGGWSSQKLDYKNIEFNSDTAFLYGIRAGFRILFFVIEGNYFQAAHNISIADIDWSGRKVDYNHLGLSLRLLLPLPFINPYLTFGYGRYSAEIKDLGDDSNTGYNVGLGLELHLGQSFSLLGEGKYNNVGLTVRDDDLDINNWTIHVGLNFYF